MAKIPKIISVTIPSTCANNQEEIVLTSMILTRKSSFISRKIVINRLAKNSMISKGI